MGGAVDEGGESDAGSHRYAPPVVQTAKRGRIDGLSLSEAEVLLAIHRRDIDPVGAGLEDLSDLISTVDEKIREAHRIHFRERKRDMDQIRRPLVLAALRSKQISDQIDFMLEHL